MRYKGCFFIINTNFVSLWNFFCCIINFGWIGIERYFLMNGEYFPKIYDKVDDNPSGKRSNRSMNCFWLNAVRCVAKCLIGVDCKCFFFWLVLMFFSDFVWYQRHFFSCSISYQSIGIDFVRSVFFFFLHMLNMFGMKNEMAVQAKLYDCNI